MAKKKSRKKKRNRILASIAVFKYLKAILLIAAGFGMLKLLQPGRMERAWDAVGAIASPFIRSKLEHALGRAGESKHLKALGIGAFFYAALFFVEGTGLWLEQRWAEYLTVFATASFIPIECWELGRKITAPRIAAFLLNVAILIYLIWQLRRDREEHAPAGKH